MRFVVPSDATSWVEVANDSHFPIQNLPFGSVDYGSVDASAVIRIGDYVLDLFELYDNGLLHGEAVSASLDDILDEGGPETLSDIRRQVFELLRSDNAKLRDNKGLRERVLRHIDDVDVRVPVTIPAFVDFYSGINHASNVGKMFRPDMPPLLPNYRHLPVGYNGRASSVVASGEPVIRPNGQTKGANDELPTFGPSKELDFELEMGFFVGKANEMGVPIPIDQVDKYMAGLVLVNDWSARDVQRWEYQPLGPFLAKSFATSISPWIVTLDALEPFMVKGPSQDPEVLPYLKATKPFHFDVHLEVWLLTPKMSKPQRICATNARELYWSMAQQLAHQTCNGTPIDAGDLYATGTISGDQSGTFGSLLELTWRGTQPIVMEETGEERRFLEDGDRLTMTGYAQGPGFRVGFGEVTAEVMPAPSFP